MMIFTRPRPLVWNAMGCIGKSRAQCVHADSASLQVRHLKHCLVETPYLYLLYNFILTRDHPLSRPTLQTLSVGKSSRDGRNAGGIDRVASGGRRRAGRSLIHAVSQVSGAAGSRSSGNCARPCQTMNCSFIPSPCRHARWRSSSGKVVDALFYFPFDPRVARKVVGLIRPQIYVSLESEMGPIYCMNEAHRATTCAW